MRYLPLSPDDRAEMLARVGVADIDALFVDVPADKLLTEPLDLPRRPLNLPRHLLNRLHRPQLKLKLRLQNHRSLWMIQALIRNDGTIGCCCCPLCCCPVGLYGPFTSIAPDPAQSLS